MSRKHKAAKKRARDEAQELGALNWLRLELRSSKKNQVEIIHNSKLIPNCINYFGSFVMLLAELNTGQAQCELIRRLGDKWVKWITCENDWHTLIKIVYPEILKKICGKINNVVKTFSPQFAPTYHQATITRAQQVAETYFFNAPLDPFIFMDIEDEELIAFVSNPTYLKQFLEKFPAKDRLNFFFITSPKVRSIFLTNGNPAIIQDSWLFFLDEKRLCDNLSFCRMLKAIIAPNHARADLVEPFIQQFSPNLAALIKTHSDLIQALQATLDAKLQQVLLTYCSKTITQFADTASEKEAILSTLVWDNEKFFRALLTLAPSQKQPQTSSALILKAIMTKPVAPLKTPQSPSEFAEQLAATAPQERLDFAKRQQEALFTFFPTPVQLGQIRLKFSRSEQQTLQEWYKKQEKNTPLKDFATWKQFRR